MSIQIFMKKVNFTRPYSDKADYDFHAAPAR